MNTGLRRMARSRPAFIWRPNDRRRGRVEAALLGGLAAFPACGFPERVIDARLPAGSVSLERFDHVGVKAQHHGDLGGPLARPALARLTLRERVIEGRGQDVR